MSDELPAEPVSGELHLKHVGEPLLHMRQSRTLLPWVCEMIYRVSFFQS